MVDNEVGELSLYLYVEWRGLVLFVIFSFGSLTSGSIAWFFSMSLFIVRLVVCSISA